MTDAEERNYIADRVRDLLTEVRKGKARLLTEKLQHVAFLLENPGWLDDVPIELLEEAA